MSVFNKTRLLVIATALLGVMVMFIAVHAHNYWLPLIYVIISGVFTHLMARCPRCGTSSLRMNRFVYGPIAQRRCSKCGLDLTSSERSK
jgi:uncharacterized protein (DUF983 family)